MQQPLATEARPSRAQIEPAALRLLSRHSAGLLATARRYSATPEDAEDAYQRGVEILLTKAPSTREDELLAWLKTVVKHEAFAVRRLSGRVVAVEEPLAWETDEKAWTHERAERYEQLRVGAEAMAALKPHEIRCLVLKAEGLSYQEICAATGFSYTKVNRCLTEGRRAFLKQVAGIEAGLECDRLATVISKLADGEASAEEMQRVRPHLKGCLACKATLREYRQTPGRIAGLVPPVAALAGGGGGLSGLIGRLVERFAGVGDGAGAKLAAVAAGAVVIAGSGAAGIDAIHHDAPAVARSAFAATETAAAPSPTFPAIATLPASTAPASEPPDPSAAAIEAVDKVADEPATPSSEREKATQPEPKPAAPATDPAPEFDPGTTVEPGAQPAPQPREFGAAPTPSSPTGASGSARLAPQQSAPGPKPAGQTAEFGP